MVQGVCDILLYPQIYECDCERDREVTDCAIASEISPYGRYYNSRTIRVVP